MPDKNAWRKLPIVIALVYMMILDVIRVFRVARLRRQRPELWPVSLRSRGLPADQAS